MKTKQEAMERPERGDRWRKGKRLLTLVRLTDTGICYSATGGAGVRMRDGEPPINAFRRWCANAEYMGGAE